MHTEEKPQKDVIALGCQPCQVFFDLGSIAVQHLDPWI